MATNIQDIFAKIDRRADLSLDELGTYTTWALSTPHHGRGNAEQVRTLREYHRRAIDASDAMVTVAEGESRGLLASEQRAFDKLMAHAGQIQTFIERLEQRDRLDPPYQVPDVLRGTGGRSRFEPDRNGVVTLRSQDRVSDYVRAAGHAGPSAIDRASFGEFVRAIVTGDHRHLSEFEARAMGASTLTAGGILTPSPIAANVLDYARAKSAIFAAGAVLVPMESGTLVYAKVTSPITPDWVSENEEADASDMAFGGVVLATKSLTTIAKVSLELVEDAPNAPQVIEDEFAAAMAAAFDTAALVGTGLQSQPKGVELWQGVHTRELGAGNGAAPGDYDFLLTAQGDCWGSHADPDSLRHILASRTAVSLAKLKEAVNLQPLRVPEAVAPRLISNQVPLDRTVGSSTDCSLVFTGDFRQLVIGVRIAFQFEISRSAGDSTGSSFKASQIWMRGRMRGDVGVLRADHFCVTSGVRE
jgi:HK97 family phage major capsid protein